MKAVTEEIRLRIDEELDYELEAQNQRSLARIFRGHPFIVVPDVVTRMSRERVIVGEFVEGDGFEELKGYPQEERDRLGEIIFRFFMGCLLSPPPGLRRPASRQLPAAAPTAASRSSTSASSSG